MQSHPHTQPPDSLITPILQHPSICPIQTRHHTTKNHARSHSSPILFKIRSSQRLYHTRALTKPRPEDTIRIQEHVILQTDHDELAALEATLDQTSDVLGVG